MPFVYLERKRVMSSFFPIREVRITLTVASYEEAVQFYRDGLTAVCQNVELPMNASFRERGGSHHGGTFPCAS